MASEHIVRSTALFTFPFAHFVIQGIICTAGISNGRLKFAFCHKSIKHSAFIYSTTREYYVREGISHTLYLGKLFSKETTGSLHFVRMHFSRLPLKFTVYQ